MIQAGIEEVSNALRKTFTFSFTLLNPFCKYTLLYSTPFQHGTVKLLLMIRAMGGE